MKRSERTAAAAYRPGLMDELTAAAYVSMSVTKIRELRAVGRFPTRVKCDGRLLYLIEDLDNWRLNLPREDEDTDGDERRLADEAFG